MTGSGTAAPAGPVATTAGPVPAEGGPLERVGQDLGIPALGEAPWGTHFCQFFGGRQDLIDVLVPFFRTGLERNEACLFTTGDPFPVEDAIETLAPLIDGFSAALQRGQIAVVSPFGRYVQDGVFDPLRVLDLVPVGVADALKHGYSGRRACTNESWLREGDWDPMMLLESRLTGIVSGHRTISMCAYPLGRCDAEQLVEVLIRHRFALVRHEDWTLIEPSERKRATEAVERMNVALAQRTAALQSALAELQGFSRWVTHDLRAPLGSISSFGDRLAEVAAGKLDPDELAMVERIRGSAARMEQLITGIGEYAHAQQAPLTPRAVDVRALVAETWPAAVRHAQVGTVPGLSIESLPMAVADRSLLAMALTALLANAVAATAGQPDGLVEVGTTSLSEGGFAYYVRDNGIGFDPEHAESMFTAFTRLHSVARTEGAGLGLAIAHTVVTRHGGHVWADGRPGAGATFWFTLPEPGHPEEDEPALAHHTHHPVPHPRTATD